MRMYEIVEYAIAVAICGVALSVAIATAAVSVRFTFWMLGVL